MTPQEEAEMCRADRYCRVYIDEVEDVAERMGCRVIRNRNGVSLHYPDRVKRMKRLEKKREQKKLEEQIAESEQVK